jgi:hypothetical protein
MAGAGADSDNLVPRFEIHALNSYGRAKHFRSERHCEIFFKQCE